MATHNAISREEESRFIRVGIQAEIDRLQARLAALNGADVNSPSSSGNGTEAPRKKRRKMSAEARARIAEATRRRWALRKGGESTIPSGPVTAHAEEKPRRGRPRKNAAKPGRKPGRPPAHPAQ